jgi:6-phosphogluconolactonase
MNLRSLSLSALPLAMLGATGCSGAPDATASAGAESIAASDDALTRGDRGHVYTLGNEAEGNAVLVFDRARDGALTLSGKVATGGLGSGSGLGSQGALTASRDGRWLFAVDAGSHQISTFAVRDGEIELRDVTDSGGERPISVTESDGIVYVLNAGGAQNVTGFYQGYDGALRPIPRSTRPLSGGAADVGPAEVRLTPDGDALVVTEKATSRIDAYPLRFDAIPRHVAPIVTASAGDTPFGFAFDPRGTLIVSDAFGGAAGSGAVSSYRVTSAGVASLVTGPLATAQSAPCWVAVTPGGGFAYAANTASGTITGLRIGHGGALSSLGDGGATASTGADSKPADLAFTRRGDLLFVLEGGTSSLGAFRVAANGALEAAGVTPGLPAHAVGLVAR